MQQLIVLGFQYKFIDNRSIFEIKRLNDLVNNGEGYAEDYDYISYHELFSVDSGLMEFVKWKEPPKFFLPQQYTDEENKGLVRKSYHYGAMRKMTAEQKMKYFLENAELPVF